MKLMSILSELSKNHGEKTMEGTRKRGRPRKDIDLGVIFHMIKNDGRDYKGCQAPRHTSRHHLHQLPLSSQRGVSS